MFSYLPRDNFCASFCKSDKLLCSKYFYFLCCLIIFFCYTFPCLNNINVSRIYLPLAFNRFYNLINFWETNIQKLKVICLEYIHITENSLQEKNILTAHNSRNSKKINTNTQPHKILDINSRST